MPNLMDVKRAESLMGADWVQRQQEATNPPGRFLNTQEAESWRRACEWLEANKSRNGRVGRSQVPAGIWALCNNADRRAALGLVRRWTWNNLAFYSVVAGWQKRWDALMAATPGAGSEGIKECEKR